MTKEYWITDSRFKFIALLLFLMFIIFMGVVIWKAEALTKNPCQICAKKMGEVVQCYTQGSNGAVLERDYFPNFTILNKLVGE